MTAAALALHLARRIPAIACDEAAGLFYTDIRNAVDAIERCINRPIPPRYCGPCPQLVDHDTRCGAALLAPREANQVTCWSCKTIHDIDHVTAQLWAEVDEWLLTPSEIHLVMDYFGEPVPSSTIRRWKMEGRLKARGYRDGKPRYWPGDVRRLRNGDAA